MQYYNNMEKVEPKLQGQAPLSILHTMLESISDGVLVVSREGSIITCNHRFLELWGIPESLGYSGNDNLLLMFVKNQLKKPDEFMTLVDSAYANPEIYVNDILEFKDGKFFKRYSKPQKVGDEIVGRIWCFRDITEQKKLEEEITSLNLYLENKVVERTIELHRINKRLEDVNVVLKEEISERKRVEEEIKKLNNELENKVIARTLLLENANSELNEEIAEREKVEIELRNNLMLMQTLIDSIYYPIIYKNPMSSVLGYNKAYENLFRSSEESLIDKTVFEIRPKEIAEKHHKVDIALMEKPGFKIYESSEVDKDGDLHEFSVIKSTFQNVDGSIGGIIDTMIDMTEKNEIDTALKESENRFRATFEQAAVGIVHATLDGKFLKVNQKFCNIVGYAENELLNMSFMEITHPDDMKMDMGQLAKLIGGEINTFSMEKRYFKKDNTIIWVNLTVSAINQLSGEHTYVMGVVEDISERKYSEEAVKSSEYTLRTLFEGTPDVILIIEDNTVINCNQAAVDLLRYDSKSGILGKRSWELSPERQPDGELSKDKILTISRAARKKGKAKFEWWLRNNDNSLITVEIMLTSILLKGKKVFLALCRDVSDRKQMEQKLEYLSYHDQLTGLKNRRFYERELKILDVEKNLPLTVIIADVNGLKLVNDSFGHSKGDVLLKKAAKVMKKGCRASDMVARLGGDEFVILLPNTDSYEAERILKRIKALSKKERIGSIDISISYGYETKTNKEEEIQEILKKAEDQMYKEKLFESPSMRGKTISAIITTLHEKNRREEQHSYRVSELCQCMGETLGLPEGKIGELKNVGLLHDIGKIAIEENILNKPGKLTDEEWEEIKRHPEIGYRILSTVSDMSEIAEYVLAHHERWDGKGYPKGLRDEEIPLQSRILAIADTYDAITSERSYRKALSKETAIEELRKNAGVQFDPKLISVFIDKVSDKI